MIWRRITVSSASTLRELHGIIQVAMGWEGIHLFQFDIRAVNYGSWELHGASPDIGLHNFNFRRNDRFFYIYDMGDYWKHDIRVEAFPDENLKKAYPICTGGSGLCPPEDCGGVEGFLARRDEAHDYDAWQDVGILSDFASDLLECHDTGKSMADLDMSDVQFAMDRINAREPFVAGRFSRKRVNRQLRDGLHRELVHQQLM